MAFEVQVRRRCGLKREMGITSETRFMPPFVIPPLVKFALGTAGVAAIAAWVLNEIRRINEEIARVQTATIVERAQRATMPTLRRDPRSGEWRL